MKHAKNYDVILSGGKTEERSTSPLRLFGPVSCTRCH